jgi:hypothetical protein
MPWCINLNQSHAVIESYFSGEVTSGEIMAAFYEIIAQVHQHNTNLIFTDCSALKGGFSLFDYYPLMKELESSDEYRFLKQAILLPMPAHLTRSFIFWETACNSRGYRVKNFTCRQSAFYWLSQTNM